MSKYSVEEVRRAVKLFAGYSATHHGIGGGLMDIALAFAERIEADEGAVPVAKIRHFDYHGIARNGFSQEAEMLDGAPELPDGTELFTHPPAQAAQLDGWREFIEQCAETSGGEVDGNRLSRKAKELLAAAPSPGDPS